MYCATHCIGHGIRGYVCHLLRGTCSLCTHAMCYGCDSLCLERVVLCVSVYCAPYYIIDGIRGYVCHLLRGTCSLITFAVCYGSARTCRTMSSGVLCYTLNSTWGSRVGVHLSSRHLLCVYVCNVLHMCFPVPRTCRTMCTGVLCYILLNTWDSRVYLSFTSRHVLF